MDAIINRLNHFFKKDSTITKCQPFKSFMMMSIQMFLNEFNKCLFKTKTYGTTMADDILAYDLLKSANLATHEATIPDHQYNIMKDQLKKTISDAS